MSDEFGLPAATLACIRGILAGCPAVERAIIYGSRARGNFRRGSDIDLTLLGDGLGPRELARLAGQLDESPIPYIVDLSLFAQLDNPRLVDHIQRVGKLFYQRA